MTEEEAKTKWCHRTLAPMLMASGAVIYSPSPCIASACMAWLWHDDSFQWLKEGPRPPTNPENPQGFCGAAGSPFS